MAIRITGMNSGLDTESIISELVKAKSTKKDDLVKAQTKLQWKQDAWKELNTKVYALYSKTLSNMRLASDYKKKTTKVSNANAVSVITSANAVNGVQTVKVKQLAKSGYLTGAELKETTDGKAVTGSTTMKELGITDSELTLKVGETTKNIELSETTTINDVVKQMKEAGVNASFDEKNHRFFVSSKSTGLANEFELTSGDKDTLLKLGIAEQGLTAEEKNAYAKEYLDAGYITVNAEGVYSYKEGSVTSQHTRVKEAVQKRLEEYEKNQSELKDTQEKQKTFLAENTELVTKYSLTDAEGTPLSGDDLAGRISELKEKIAKAENPEGTQPQEEEAVDVSALKEDLAKLEEYSKLRESESKLQAQVEAGKDDFAWDDEAKTWKATDALVDRVVEQETAKAKAAVGVLNHTECATRIKASDALIELNGAEFTSDTNNFEINGLTITANMVTDEEFTITTEDDTNGIYDMIKNFFKEYNELINEMDKLYNADSSKGYEPLTDEEKDAMSEKEIEKWEEKIKDSILRRDSTLSTVSSAMKQVMLQGVTMSDGNKMYLSEFGIGTLGYFSSSDNEKNAYHIDGDPDDSNTMTNADKLKTAIANDPEKVIEFFSTLSKNLYEKLGDLMKKTEYSSSFTLYDDVAMKDEYNDYTTKISDQEEKISDYEDRYYKKFSAMEVALAKLQSKESALSGLFGG